MTITLTRQHRDCLVLTLLTVISIILIYASIHVDGDEFYTRRKLVVLLLFSTPLVAAFVLWARLLYSLCKRDDSGEKPSPHTVAIVIITLAVNGLALFAYGMVDLTLLVIMIICELFHIAWDIIKFLC